MSWDGNERTKSADRGVRPRNWEKAPLGPGEGQQCGCPWFSILLCGYLGRRTLTGWGKPADSVGRWELKPQPLHVVGDVFGALEAQGHHAQTRREDARRRCRPGHVALWASRLGHVHGDGLGRVSRCWSGRRAKKAESQPGGGESTESCCAWIAEEHVGRHLAPENQVGSILGRTCWQDSTPDQDYLYTGVRA
jgi:hypothetical protein